MSDEPTARSLHPSARAKMPTCARCAWAEPMIGDEQSIYVECRLNPPMVVSWGESLVGAFPQIESDSWCSHWAPDER